MGPFLFKTSRRDPVNINAKNELSKNRLQSQTCECKDKSIGSNAFSALVELIEGKDRNT